MIGKYFEDIYERYEEDTQEMLDKIRENKYRPAQQKNEKYEIPDITPNSQDNIKNFKYKIIENNNVEIEKYIGSNTYVTIPSKINGRKVVSIGSNAFNGCTHLRNICISPYILDINYGSFANCINLKEVILPDNVVNIRKYAFDHCSQLSHIVFNDKLLSIGAGAFQSCSNLYSNIETLSKLVAMSDFITA